MALYYYYVVGQYHGANAVVLETFDNADKAYDLVGILNELANEGEYYFVTTHYPGDIQQL